jgi:hypothetical protein
MTGTRLFAQEKVFVLPNTPTEKPVTGQYFYYMLPTTALQVEVTLTKTIEFKGYYGDYAEKLLGLTRVISDNKITYNLKNVHVNVSTMPDTTRVYGVELSKAQVKSGFLSRVHENRGVEFTRVPLQDYTVVRAVMPEFFRDYADFAYTKIDDSFLDTRIVNGIVSQVPVSQTKVVSKTLGQKAQEAADFILNIRKDRYHLLSGEDEAAYPEGTFARMIDELNVLERNYLALFTGFTLEEEEKICFTIFPDEKQNRHLLFSLDTEAGFSPTVSMNTEQNYYLVFTPMLCSRQFEDGIAGARGQKYKGKANAGYRVRYPVPVSLSLQCDNRVLQEMGTLPFLQWGKIETLPAREDHFDILSKVIVY